MKNNIVWTCKKHGKETYFEIKESEKQKNMKNFVYVWFKDKEGRSEKMWVRIRSGTQHRGFGTLDNVPVILKEWKVGDTLFFQTGRNKITVPVSKEVYGH